MSNTVYNQSNYRTQEISLKTRALKATHRMGIAIEAISKKSPLSQVARIHEVSRKFVYQQKNVAIEAMSQAFCDLECGGDDQVLASISITKDWLHRMVLELILVCHASFRNVCEILQDRFHIQMSIGTVSNIVTKAVERARQLSVQEDLSLIKVGAHDEIFQGGMPVLVGCDVESTYCYLLAAVEHLDAESWGVSLLDASAKGLNPDFTIGDRGLALRAGQAMVWPNKPCHSDVFHALHELGKARIYLENRAYGTISALGEIERKMIRIKKHAKGNKLSKRLGLARIESERAIALSDDITILFSWLQKDILSLTGPDLKTREKLFDFFIAELHARELQAYHRIAPVRRKLENQKEDLLRFVDIIDHEIEIIAREYDVNEFHVRQLFMTKTPELAESCRVQQEGKIRELLADKFDGINDRLEELIKKTVRASSVAENLNSRLRNYFFLRKQIGPAYLDLLRFFLNHHRFIRSEHPDHEGKSPLEILTGQQHSHWLDMLMPPCSGVAALAA